MLGAQRVGPDLANAGLRMDAAAVLARLWDARAVEPKSLMPPYKYLFDVRKIGRTPSPDALAVGRGFAAPQGYEIVPRPAARALAAYVASLRQEPYLFEAPPPPGSAGTNAPAAGSPDVSGPALPAGTNRANPQLAAPKQNEGGSAITNPQSSDAPAK
jgi:cytochrome c oxidase cbb3-type subunit 2